MSTRTTCRVCGKTIPEFPSEYAYCVECRYHDAPQVKAWDDDDDAPPPPEPFVLPEECEPEPETFDLQRELLADALRNFLRLITAKNTALQTGQIAHVLAFLMGATDYQTKAGLARQLKVSPGRISQVLAELPPDLHTLARLKRRTKVKLTQ